MKHNTQEVAALQPDYLGFIFYEKSKRDFGNLEIPELPEGIDRVGVFVDADIAFAKAKIIQHNLNVIQLHGSESPAYINELQGCLVERSRDLKIWKVFGIKNNFYFEKLKPYEGIVDGFLFDTKGKEKGGNGYTFDWSVLKDYTSQTPIILSGGIGLEEVEKITKILATDLPIIALDVNSKFEDKPGMKNIEKLKKFKAAIAAFTPSRS
ncbi:phosphoribosylanthranilate isomerase [Dokdonia sp. R78006]|uniref:phosphoribosylanthranilate isomerase n=1 Tax=Dokdonia sp. R78006 TaxID=3093866 RepID=UPI0036D3216F